MIDESEWEDWYNAQELKRQGVLMDDNGQVLQGGWIKHKYKELWRRAPRPSPKFGTLA